MPQTSVDKNPGIAYAGQVAELGWNRDSRSMATEGPGILCGQPVLLGTDPDCQVKAIEDGDTVDGFTLAGFVIFSSAMQPSCCPTATPGLPEKCTISVMCNGTMYVEVAAPVVAGEEVYVGNTAATLGQISGTAGAGLVLVEGARFVKGAAAAGDLAIVKLDL